MKTLFTTLLFMLFASVCFSQEPEEPAQKRKPKAEYKIGAAKITVWVNKRSDGTTWKNFKVEKLYKKNDQWLSTDSFSETELLELKAAIDKAISEEAVKKN